MTKKEALLGIGFTGAPYGVKEIVRIAKTAESEGYSSLWFAEDYFLRDAITNLSCVAYATKRITISTGVINPFTRNPVLIAETFATLQELSKGRAKLALGTGVQPLIEKMGIDFQKPILAIRESVNIIKRLLKGDKVDYAGEVFSARGVKLGDNPYFSLPGGDFKLVMVPIYIAAIGPRMLQLAGELADGVLLTAGFAAENVKQALPRIGHGAKKLGRSIRGLDIACYIMTCLGNASKAIRCFLAFDVAYSRPENLDAIGISEERIVKIRMTLERKGVIEASTHITQDIVDSLTACGTKERIQDRIEEYRASGVTHPILLPVETNALELIRSVA
jgi:5,10-methylenetetrahydromethanopterin reductase